MSDEPRKKKDAPEGAPMWMATFADMATLLLCFFVLILSFSDINQKKFKQVTATLKMAFGAQRLDPFEQIPIANSLTMDAYSSARDSLVKLDHPKVQFDIELPKIEELLNEQQKQAEKEKSEQFENNLKAAKDILDKEENQGKLEVVVKGKTVIIRIKENVSFTSGSDFMKDGFNRTLKSISAVIKKSKGNIQVSGHTDDLPIKTVRFRNNWDLSASRASTIGTKILADSKISPKRLVIQGHADTRPIVKNDSAKNRARNRRVEIAIIPNVKRKPASSSKPSTLNLNQQPKDYKLPDSVKKSMGIKDQTPKNQ